MKEKIIKSFIFYNKKIKKIHFITCIIMIIIFFLTYSFVLNDEEIASQIITKSRLANFIETIQVSILVTISGAVPYIFIPAIGVLAIPISLGSMLVNYSGLYIIYIILGSLLKIYIYSLMFSIGIYICKLATSRYRYNSNLNFGLDQMRKDIYTKMNKKEELEKVEEKIRLKNIKRENLNVKIPYMNLIILTIINLIIISGITLIFGV